MNLVVSLETNRCQLCQQKRYLSRKASVSGFSSAHIIPLCDTAHRNTYWKHEQLNGIRKTLDYADSTKCLQRTEECKIWSFTEETVKFLCSSHPSFLWGTTIASTLWKRIWHTEKLTPVSSWNGPSTKLRFSKRMGSAHCTFLDSKLDPKFQI